MIAFHFHFVFILKRNLIIYIIRYISHDLFMASFDSLLGARSHCNRHRENVSKVSGVP